jgi:CubicO group peptidase (beta-lactamase class C family)
VDRVAQDAMQKQGIPGMTVALAKNGAMLYVNGYGFSDLTTRQPTEPPVILEIGSITKTLVSSPSQVYGHSSMQVSS